MVEWNSAFAANPVALSALRKATDGAENEISNEEYDALRRTLIGLYFMYDNAHYQYQAGFVSSEFWGMTREGLAKRMAIPVVNEVRIDMSFRGGRPDFRNLVREIGEQQE